VGNPLKEKNKREQVFERKLVKNVEEDVADDEYDFELEVSVLEGRSGRIKNPLGEIKEGGGIRLD